MVRGVQNSSILQALRAEHAFKNAGKYSGDVNFDLNTDSIDNVQVKKDVSSNRASSQKTLETQNIDKENSNKAVFKSSLLDYKKDMVNDFKQFIGKRGNLNIDDEDIDYALRYGKSILVDKRA